MSAGSRRAPAGWHVVFDLGAVVFSWKPLRLMQDVFAAVATDEAGARALARQIFAHADWEAFDAGLLDDDAIAQRTAQRLNLPLSAVGRMVELILERLHPIPETVELVHELLSLRDADQGVAGVYFLSNMPRSYARALEQRHGFLARFNGGIFSADVGMNKPDPRIYRMLAQRHELPAPRTVFADDLPANVQAAQALGWSGVVFTQAEDLRRFLRPHLNALSASRV